MKKLLFIAFSFSILTVAVCGQAKSTASVYTSLATKACKTIESNPDEGGSYRGLCPGFGAYKLELLEGDLRQSINVIAPNKKKYELDLWSVVSSGFSSLGEKAEWRLTGKGKAVAPNALILRYNASENPADSSVNTSYLVVVRIDNSTACVTDVVKPGANQNATARKLADAAAAKPCKANQ